MRHIAPFRGIFAVTGMLILILDSKTALMGARSGVELILNTVIPSLFPFFFLSILLSNTKGMEQFPLLRPIGTLFRIPDGLQYLVIPAFLGGYPTGAQAVSSAWKQGRLSKESAQRLLGYCSNAGPSFLFGILHAFFPETWMCWTLWGLHILGALLTSRMLPGNSCQPTDQVSNDTDKNVQEILIASLKVMGNVCGWLLMFRVVLAYLDKWFFPFFSPSVRVLLSGLLEMTNGCCILSLVYDIRLRFFIASVLLSMGGLCVLMQTKSVTEGLSLRWYYYGKCTQAIFSGSMAIGILYHIWLPLIILTVFACFLHIRKKEVAIRPSVVYNSSI